jgi:hypothetical protein
MSTFSESGAARRGARSSKAITRGAAGLAAPLRCLGAVGSRDPKWVALRRGLAWPAPSGLRFPRGRLVTSVYRTFFTLRGSFLGTHHGRELHHFGDEESGV